MKLLTSFLLWSIQDNALNTQKTLLCIATLTGAFLSLGALLINTSLSFPPLLLGINLLFCLLYGFMYYNVRFRTASYTHYASVFTYTTLLLLACSWPLNAGVTGPVPMFFIGLLMLSAFFLETPKAYLLFTIILISTFCMLVTLDLQSTAQDLLAPAFATHTWDMAGSAWVILLACSASLYAFRRRYTQEQQLLKSAADYKSRFLAQMSHEMRTPLNAILGFSKHLHQHPELSQDKKDLYLNRVYENGLSLLAFFEDLLDISKIESGQLRLHPQTVNVDELLKQCYTRYEQHIHNKALHYDALITGPTEIVSDPHRLKQIIGNLLHNAIKFTPARGQITAQVFQSHHQLCIEIKDTGPGIKQSDQALIFTPFYRTQHQIEGSGLGLAIVHELCDLLGYKLRLHSEEGQGCTFQIWIPL